MLVKNKKSGEIETLRYGPAAAAVAAGTHEIVNLGSDGKPIEVKVKAKPTAKSAEAK